MKNTSAVVVVVAILIFLSYQSRTNAQITGLSVSNIGISTATFTWNPSSSLNSYYIEYFKRPQTTYPQLTSKQSATTTVVEGLDSGTDYGAQVVGGDNNAMKSTVVVFSTPGIKPLSLFAITAIGVRSVTVKWTPNTDETYEFYEVVLKNKDGQIIAAWPMGLDILQNELKGLNESTYYQIGIKGVYKDQHSSLKVKGFTTAIEIPKALSLRAIEKTSDSATITWVKNEANGRKVFHYDLEYNVVGNDEVVNKITLDQISSGETTTLNGLTSDTMYRVRLQQIAGTQGFRSEWTDWVIFQTMSEEQIKAPTNLYVASVTNEQAQLSWQANAEKSVASYRVQYYPINGRPTEPKNIGKITTYAMKELVSGTEYICHVEAVSKSGKIGPSSTAKLFTTRGPKPVHHFLFIVDITSVSAKVSWVFHEQPDHDNVQVKLQLVSGTDSNGNTMFQDLTTKTLGKNITETTLQNLEANTGYRVTVYTTSVMNGPSSKVGKGFRTALTKELIRTAVVCQTSIGQGETLGDIIFSCNQRPTNMQKFQVEIGVTSGSVRHLSGISEYPDANNGMFTITGLYSGYTYNIKVTAVFYDGTKGLSTAAYQIPIPHGRPPVFVEILDITDRKAKISWIPPFYDSPTNYGYEVTYKPMNESGPTPARNVFQKDQTHFFVEDLKPLTVYSVTVRTKLNDDEYAGTAITKAFLTGRVKPSMPLYPAIKVQSNTAAVEWELIQNRTDIKYYEVSLQDQRHVFPIPVIYRTNGKYENSFQFPNGILAEDVIYYARVRAVVNDRGLENSHGFWSTKLAFKVGDKHETSFLIAPGQSKLIQTSSSTATIQWQLETQKSALGVLVRVQDVVTKEYIIIRVSVLNGLAHVKNLEAKKTYTYQMQTVGQNSEASLWTPLLRFTMEEMSPSSSSSSSSSSGLSSGQIVGIVFAVAVVLVILTSVLYIFYRRRKVTLL